MGAAEAVIAMVTGIPTPSLISDEVEASSKAATSVTSRTTPRCRR